MGRNRVQGSHIRMKLKIIELGPKGMWGPVELDN